MTVLTRSEFETIFKTISSFLFPEESFHGRRYCGAKKKQRMLFPLLKNHYFASPEKSVRT